MTTLSLAHLTLSTTPAQTIDAAAAAGFTAVGLRICARRPTETFAADPILGHPAAARALRRQAAVHMAVVLAAGATERLFDVDVKRILGGCAPRYRLPHA